MNSEQTKTLCDDFEQRCIAFLVPLRLAEPPNEELFNSLLSSLDNCLKKWDRATVPARFFRICIEVTASLHNIEGFYNGNDMHSIGNINARFTEHILAYYSEFEI